MPGARLLRFARRVALSARKKRCALPGCGRDARVLSCFCCGKALCAQCRVHTLRASFGRRLVSRCPFCRRAARPRAAVLKRMMAAACPSHALVVETEGGPPSVVAHLSCLEGLIARWTELDIAGAFVQNPPACCEQSMYFVKLLSVSIMICLMNNA